MADEYQQRLTHLRRQVHAANARAQAARSRAKAANGAVTVEFSASGALEELRIEPSAMRMDPARLAEAIEDGYRRAAAEARHAAQSALDSLADTVAGEDLKTFIREFVDQPGPEVTTQHP